MMVNQTYKNLSLLCQKKFHDVLRLGELNSELQDLIFKTQFAQISKLGSLA